MQHPMHTSIWCKNKERKSCEFEKLQKLGQASIQLLSFYNMLYLVHETSYNKNKRRPSYKNGELTKYAAVKPIRLRSITYVRIPFVEGVDSFYEISPHLKSHGDV